MIAAAHAQRILAAWQAAVAPPRAARDLPAVASRLRVPDPLDPRRTIPWPWQRHPAQAAILRAIGSRRWRRYVPLGPVQDGKTLGAIEAASVWCTSELRRPVVIGMPTRDLLGRFWRGKLKPDLQASGLAHLLPSEGLGSSTGAPDDVLLDGCHLYMLAAGGKNEAAQSSVTGWLVALDEIDSMRGRAIRLLLERAAAHDDRIEILTSTIKADAVGESRILGEYDRGTRGRIELPCPHCGTYHEPAIDHLTYDPATDATAATTVRLACPSCGALYDDDQRRHALTSGLAREVHGDQTVDPSGAICGPMPESATWSLRWTALTSPRRSLADLAVRHRQAQLAIDQDRDHEPMRQVYRDHLVLPYQAVDADLIAVHEAIVATRSAEGSHQRGDVPAWATRLVVACDVQLRRHYWIALAGGPGGRLALVDWGMDALCGDHEQPQPGQRHALLDRHAAQFADGWQAADGSRMRPAIIGCDVNAYTDELLAWLRYRWGTWAATIGAGRERADRMAISAGSLQHRIPGWLEIRTQPAGWRAHFVDADHVRERVHAGLAIPLGSPGSLALPRGIAADSPIARHLTAEVQRRTDAGAVVWVQRHQRNDWLDCAVYGAALDRLLAWRAGETPDAPPAAQQQQQQQPGYQPAAPAQQLAPPPISWIDQTATAGGWV